MEILGIGAGELLLIALLILILFRPKDMVATGKNLGQWLNRIVHSPTYKLLTKTGEELKNLPRNLMREANIDEFNQIGKDLNEQTQSIGRTLARSFDEKQIFENPQIAGPPPPESPSQPPAQKTDESDAPQAPKEGGLIDEER
ncbi:MAG: twin-arginine translocase TatA/TatE family subunit [Anaerolineales bacterium]|jgi:Sec-independent protein translocase protein TatA|nr:twin-arginine translocase TatA/TatE family subunit [Anaerolineales bacterium]